MINYKTDGKLVNKGIKVAMALFSVDSISKRRGSGLEKYIKYIIAELGDDDGRKDAIFDASEEWYRLAGVEGISPSRHLLQIIAKSGKLPNINRVVDIYNIVSVQTGLSLGAHDCAAISGDIVFRPLSSKDTYTPLLSSEIAKVGDKEYGCCDEEKVLCRMDLKQCDQTKVTADTRNFIVYVQGNKSVTQSEVNSALGVVCTLMQDYCAAEYEILSEGVL